MKMIIIPLVVYAGLVISSGKVQGQSDYFGDPVALSDSVSDNFNAVIAWPFMFWERMKNKSTTEIYFRNLDIMSDPQPVFPDSGFHYRNPRAVDMHGEPLNCLFYESDKKGDWDICYRTYDDLGNFSDEYPFFHTDSDEAHLRITTNSFETKEGLVWESGGVIRFTTIENLQGQPAFNPPNSWGPDNFNSPEIGRTTSNHFVAAWRRENQDESVSLMVSRTTDFGITWDYPFEIFTAEEISSIMFSNPLWDGSYISLCLETLEYGTWHPRLCTFIYPVYELYELDFGLAQQESCTPVYFNYWAPCDQEIYDDVVSFVGYDNGQADVFAIVDYWTWPINLTNTIQDERNPGFFIGEFFPDYIFQLWDIWESCVNDHWQIFGAYALLGGTGIFESRVFLPESLVVNPNPSSGDVHLSFELISQEKVRIEFFDLVGEKTGAFKAGSFPAGWNRMNLRLDKYLNKPGSFVLCLRAGNDMLTTKIIYVGAN
ncbi:MAG: exo-alpha-sialidase [Bacteroidales bacterium]|nr:exo-alpha-sialidase [Bacteroidales bacterium]